MIISRGLREQDFSTAAALYWQAFGGKLRVPMGPADRAMAYVTRVIDPSHAIAAHDVHGKLLGVVGFKTTKGALVGGTFGDLQAIYGVFGATWRALMLNLLERDTENERFLMDGIFVDPAARGQGVGTALLHAVMEEARKRGFNDLRLEVIDSNPRARKLYEREGFVAIKSHDIGPLRHIFGFQSATTMVCQVR